MPFPPRHGGGRISRADRRTTTYNGGIMRSPRKKAEDIVAKMTKGLRYGHGTLVDDQDPDRFKIWNELNRMVERDELTVPETGTFIRPLLPSRLNRASSL
jgi:hypothetical protein